jgi:hypothetical protein
MESHEVSGTMCAGQAFASAPASQAYCRIPTSEFTAHRAGGQLSGGVSLRTGDFPSIEDRFWAEKAGDRLVDQVPVGNGWRGHQSMFFRSFDCRIETERVGQNPAFLLTPR